MPAAQLAHRLTDGSVIGLELQAPGTALDDSFARGLLNDPLEWSSSHAESHRSACVRFGPVLRSPPSHVPRGRSVRRRPVCFQRRGACRLFAVIPTREPENIFSTLGNRSLICASTRRRSRRPAAAERQRAQPPGFGRPPGPPADSCPSVAGRLQRRFESRQVHHSANGCSSRRSSCRGHSAYRPIPAGVSVQERRCSVALGIGSTRRHQNVTYGIDLPGPAGQGR